MPNDKLESIKIVPRVDSPLYPGKHPKDNDKINEAIRELEQIDSRIKERAQKEINSTMGWWDRVKWARGIIKEYAPQFVERAAGWETMSNEEKKEAVTDMLLFIVKILEKYVNIIPGYMEAFAWMIIKRNISKIIETAYSAFKSKRKEATLNA
ncbi:MAG: hypothetical protein WDA12_05060 [Bacilli bacterium]